MWQRRTERRIVLRSALSQPLRCYVGPHARLTVCSRVVVRSPVPADFFAALGDLYHKDTNPAGSLVLCIAENRQCVPQMAAKLRQVSAEAGDAVCDVVTTSCVCCRCTHGTGRDHVLTCCMRPQVRQHERHGPLPPRVHCHDPRNCRAPCAAGCEQPVRHVGCLRCRQPPVRDSL